MMLSLLFVAATMSAVLTGFGFKVDVRSRVVDENIDYLQGIFDVTTDDVRERTISQLYRTPRLTPFCVKFSPRSSPHQYREV